MTAVAGITLRPVQRTDCKEWDTDGWSGYGRVLPEEVDPLYQQDLDTTMFVRTNGIVRQQTGRWHRRQNMLGNYSRTASRVKRTFLGLE